MSPCQTAVLRLILTRVSVFALALPEAAVARAAEISVAVAANFAAPAKEFAAALHAQTGDTLALSFGSSGQFYTQISQGTPFEVFLSADAAQPKRPRRRVLQCRARRLPTP
jgi:molybdate transport system substrate-binding protein